METVEKYLKPLNSLKNGAGKLVGKPPFFHVKIHAFSRLRGVSHTISIFKGRFPANSGGKPFDKYHETSCFQTVFPWFPHPVENFLWKTKP